MAREMDSVQAGRARRSHIAPLALVKLTTYTDRTGGTVDKVFYLSNLAVDYDYGDTGTDQRFLPVIIGGSDFFSGFVHLSQPDDLTAFDQSFDLQCSNAKINGSRLVTLLQGYNLEGASIEIAQMLVGEGEMNTLPVDLSAYDGDEHTVLFRGRVNRVAPITNERLTIQATMELPSLAGSWNYASDDAKTDPQDLGKRLPRVYGKAKRVPCINWEVGWTTSIAQTLDDSQVGVGIQITNTEGFPPLSFQIRIGTEQLQCSAVDGHTITIDTRGINGTKAIPHAAGELLVELIPTAIYILSDRPCVSINELYVINPLNGVLLRLNKTDTPWTENLADTTSVPGRTVTSVQFSSVELTALIEYFQAAQLGAISVQPTFSLEAVSTENVGFSTVASDSSFPWNPGAAPWASRNCDLLSLTTSLAVVDHDLGSTDAAYAWCGSVPGSDAEAVARYRVKWVISYTGHYASEHNLVLSYRFYGQRDYLYQFVGIDAATVTNKIIYSDWHYPTGKQVDDIIRSGTPTSSSDDNFASYYEYAWRDGAGDGTSRHWVISSSEVEVELVSTDVIRTTDVEAEEGATVGFGLRFFANVDGIAAPEQEVATWETGEDFDDGTWEVSGCAVAVDTGDKVEGTGSQKMTVDVDALAGAVVIATDSLTGWTDNARATISLVDDQDQRGSDCIQAISDDPSGYAGFDYDSASLGLDLSDTGGGVGLLVFDFKIQKNGSTGYVLVHYGEEDGDYNTFQNQFDITQFIDNEWYTLICDYRLASQSGDADETDIDHFSIDFNRDSPWPDGVKVFVDNIKILREVPRSIQNNSAGGIDYTGAAARYRLSAKATASIIPDLTAYISDDAGGSGTTLPAAYRAIDFPGNWAPGSWANQEADDYADTSTPDVSDINLVHVELNLGSLGDGAGNDGGAYLRDPIFEIRLDDLAFAASMGNVYDATPGEVMIHPADIMRHWLVEQGGESFDATTYAALVTSLGANAEWGFDARSLGFTWEEILQRMAFEARCNVVAVETSAGRAWKMLAAPSSYGYGIPAGSAEITQTHGLSDVGRSVDDLASYFSFRYGFDASLPGGGNEEGFALALTASPAGSNVPITAALLLEATQRFGPRESDPIAFRCIQALATAQDSAGYIVHERMANRRRVFQLEEVAWFDALPYDVGDVVRIVPPWQDLGVEEQLYDFDFPGATGWSETNCTILNEAVTVYEGTRSMKILMDNTKRSCITGTAHAEFNVLDRSVVLWVFIPTGDLALIDFIGIRLSSAIGGATDYVQMNFQTEGLVENAWQRLEMPTDPGAVTVTGGSPDLRRVIAVWIRYQTNNYDDGTTYILVDDMKIANRSVTCRLTSMSKAFDSNAWTLTAVEVLEAGQRTP